MSRASAENGMNRSIACKTTESNMIQMRKLIPFQQCFPRSSTRVEIPIEGRGEPTVDKGKHLRYLRDAEVRQVLVLTGKCNLLGYAMLGLGLAPIILMSRPIIPKKNNDSGS